MKYRNLQIYRVNAFPKHFQSAIYIRVHKCDVFADLDQAIKAAMQAIGQEPVSLTQYAEPQNREAQLLQRIAMLESQLAAKR